MNAHTDTAEIIKALLSLKGRSVKLYAKGDRNRITSATGVLEGVYPSLFTVAVDMGGYKHRFCYTYSEVLTKNVNIKPI